MTDGRCDSDDPSQTGLLRERFREMDGESRAEHLECWRIIDRLCPFLYSFDFLISAAASFPGSLGKALEKGSTLGSSPIYEETLFFLPSTLFPPFFSSNMQLHVHENAHAYVGFEHPFGSPITAKWRSPGGPDQRGDCDVVPKDLITPLWGVGASSELNDISWMFISTLILLNIAL